MLKKLHEITFGKIDPLYHDLVERWIAVGIIAFLYYIL